MSKCERIGDLIKRRYRHVILFSMLIILFELSYGFVDFYNIIGTVIEEIIRSDLFWLIIIFLIVMISFILIIPLVAFLVDWGTYQTARTPYSLRVRSVRAYIQNFVSFKWSTIAFVIAFIRIQLRQIFSRGIFGIGMTLYLFFLYAIIVVVVQVPDDVYESSVDLTILWTLFIGVFGAGIPLSVFFIRYINENLSGITIREYLKTQVLLTIAIIINVFFALIFSLNWIISREQVIAIAAGIFLLSSTIFLTILYILLLIVPFRGKFQGPRRKAADSVIHRRALSEARSQIAGELINQYTDTQSITDDTPCSKEVTAADLGLKTGDYITDVDLRYLKSTLTDHQISHFDLSLPLGDKIRHAETIVARIVTYQDGELNENTILTRFYSDLTDSLTSNRTTYKYGTPSESPKNYLPFDGLIADVEKECKQAINENNRSEFIYRFQIYTSYLFFMVAVTDQQEISKDNSSLPFDRIYASIRRVLDKANTSEGGSIDETTVKIGAAAADLLYEHHQTIQDEFGNNQHTEQIYDILHLSQCSTPNSDLSEYISQYTDQIEMEINEITDE